ncbi:hypothetical protein DUZ99_06755 [Xylanibacillus composti]|uniref:HRDC domain-containing protein n=1 Tax=Xylanibacillus composti TaxID=1572762 RepID=A0A8J4H4U2_9BACL|nr:HRDC domain-containing protein [Xylanibacillus composti]MDT9724692.1 hypothetical protein [Xylanibacillus composti]GIQ70978.1 hypothetical protein XYCOK13_38020 [Xylanibacillus composti]
MNILFMNSLQREEGQDILCTARICVGMDEDHWRIVWTEDRMDHPSKQEDWYEGPEQEEMKAILQYRLAGKMGEGFLPVVEGLLEESVPVSNRASLSQMLVFYAERYPNKALFDRLRAWRREKAGQLGRAPFVVATNKLLHLLAVFVPHNKEEMLQIPGFGEYKWNLYGEELAALLTKESRHHSFPLQWVAQQMDHRELFVWMCRQHEHKHKNMLARHQHRKKLLAHASRKSTMDELEKELSLPKREVILLMEKLEEEGYDLSVLTASCAEEIPQQFRDSAMQAFRDQDTRFLKPVLHKLYTEEELQGQDIQQLYDWLRIVRMEVRKESSKASS